VTRYVALLRGINLGARNRVPMARLRELVEQQGAIDVRTYIVSGNVVFTSSEPAPKLRAGIEHAIESEFNIQILVVVVTAAELKRIVKDNPYSHAKPGTLHVAFAVTPLTRDDAQALKKLDFPPEELTAASTHVYMHLPTGFGTGQLNREMDKLIGKRVTVRNWRTVQTLAQMAEADE
jgi:uncharacterized protein (DUF1697 family)